MYIQIYTHYNFVPDPGAWVAVQHLAPRDQWHQHNKFSDIFGIWMFITAFTKARRLLIVNPCAILCDAQELRSEELPVFGTGWRTPPCRLSRTVSAVHSELRGALPSVASSRHATWSSTPISTSNDISDKPSCTGNWCWQSSAQSVKQVTLPFPYCTYTHTHT